MMFPGPGEDTSGVSRAMLEEQRRSCENLQKFWEMVLRVGFEAKELAAPSVYCNGEQQASKRCWCGSAAVKAERNSGRVLQLEALAEDQLAPEQDDNDSDKGLEEWPAYASLRTD